MIPEIGIVIAAYVITRMFEIFVQQLKQFRGVWSVILIGLAVVTAIVAAFVGFDLLIRGLSGGVSPAADLNPIR